MRSEVLEDMSVFKSFLRQLVRRLKDLQEAIDKNDIEKSHQLIRELIEDAQKGIED